MKNESSVIYIDNAQIKENLTKKLNLIEEFSDEDFFVENKINNLLNKLDLLEENYWKNFTKTTKDILKKFGQVIVKGLPFDDNNRLHTALANTIGNPVRHHSGIKSLVREITPRAGDNPQENFAHTDSPHWPVPNDIITLQCGREDHHIDVYSRLVHIDPVLDELKKDHSNLIKKFSEHNYPFNLQKDFGDAGYQMQPFLTAKKYSGKSETHVRFCRADSEHSIEYCNLHIDKEDINDMLIFEQIADKLGEQTQFLFKKGDWLIFDNKKIFHSKTKTSPDTVRMLKKMKLNIDREHF